MLAQRHGALFCLDEAHTVQFAYGGLTREGKPASDFVTLGKGLGSGISFAHNAADIDRYVAHVDALLG